MGHGNYSESLTGAGVFQCICFQTEFQLLKGVISLFTSNYGV